MKILPPLIACCTRRSGAGWTLLATLCLLATPLRAQVVEKWTQRYNGPGNGNDNAARLATDSAGNVFVTGASVSSGSNFDYYTAKYAAADGALLWEKRYDGPAGNYDYATCIAVDSAGNVAVSGFSHNASNADYFTAKYAAADGALLWEKRYNGPANNTDEANGIAVDSAGNVVVTGVSSNGTSEDYYTAKYAAANGALLWEKRYNGPGNNYDAANSIALDSAGNVVVTGLSVNAAFNFDYYTAKYSAADGALLWEKQYNGPANSGDEGKSIAVDGAGNVIVTGLSSNGTNNDYYTAKYAAATGALLWEKRYNGPANNTDEAKAVAVDGTGNVIVTGSSSNGATPDIYTARYAAADGALLWEKRYNGPANNYDEASSILVDGAGNVAVSGLSIGLGTSFDYYTARYAAADGALLWEKRYNGPASGNDYATSIAGDNSGNVVVTGTSSGTSTSNDYYTIKYGPLPSPTLTSPATNATTASPVGVAFTLPDSALPGSVTLTFTGGVTRTLVLAASQETSGAHGFSFTPANPTASAQIVSGSAIPDGTYTVTLSYQHNLANPAATAIATGVVLDTTPPALSNVTIASSNVNPVWAKVGETVTVSFTANEPIQPPVVTLLGVAATVVNASGNQWTASAPAGAATVQGSAAFSIVATDLPGNMANAVIATTNASLVKVDRTAPVLTLPANITVAAVSLAGAAVSFTASATDNLDPAPGVIASPASGSTFPIGTTTVNGSALDAAGNSASGSFTVTVQDRTHLPVFANAGTVPLTANGFTATGLSVGAVTLGFDPAAGQVLTLVNNTSANPIGGTFTDLPAGGTVLTNFGGRNLLFVVSYTGGTGNDVTLTLLAPEIAVEQPAGTDIADGGSKNFGTVVAGNSTSLTFTIKNSGAGILNGLTLTKNGADQAVFTVTASPTAPVSGSAGSTTFTVQFSSATSGVKTAAIHIASDDANENPFDITLTGRALSANEDTDGDGLNDAAEFLLATLGYDWQVSQPALVGTLFTNANVAGLFTQAQMDANRQAGRDDVLAAPNTFSLYTLAQIQTLNVGTPLLTRNAQTGKFTLTIGLKKSANLLQYDPLPFTGSGTTINGQGQVEFEFTAPGNAAFFRLEAR